MHAPARLLRKLVPAGSLIIGVTLITFVLMVYFGPDKSYELVGKNPTPQQLQEIRHQLGYDRPFAVRYANYLWQLVRLDFGYSDSTGERVTHVLRRTIPISLALITPGFLLGNALGILLGLWAAWYRGRWLDRLVMAAASIGMSISFLVVIVVFQLVFSSSYGLDLFPVRGWNVRDFGDYLYYVAVPSLAVIFVTLGYNTRFYRAVAVEQLASDHVRTARAYGAGPGHVLFTTVLKNSLIPFLTRILFSIPLVVVGGNLLLESYFGIPGVGKVTFDAITSGDQPVLKAVVALTAILFVLIQSLTGGLYRLVDPRLREP